MKLSLTALALALSCVAPGASAVTHDPTDKEAIAMAERGAALIKAKGKHEMMERIHARDPQFVRGGLSLNMRDLYNAILIAHPANPRLVGGVDADGLFPGSHDYPREVIELAQRSGAGWLDSGYRDTTGRSGRKKAYVKRVGDVVLEAGIYQQQ